MDWNIRRIARFQQEVDNISSSIKFGFCYSEKQARFLDTCVQKTKGFKVGTTKEKN